MVTNTELATQQQADLHPSAGVVVGVDTHQRTHHAVALDLTGRVLGDRQFAASPAGARALIGWARGFGPVDRFGVESTGSYGAGLTRDLLAAGLSVLEVQPDTTHRARTGKSDALDAHAAAVTVLSGRATAIPKLTTGVVESIRLLKTTRDGAVKASTAALGQLRDLATTAPEPIRTDLLALSGPQRVKLAGNYRPDPTRIAEPVQAAKLAARALARRITALQAEVTDCDHHLDQLTAELVPTLRALPQVGPQIAAQLVITAGQNIDRMHSEAAFARLTGTAPIPASSGKTNRMRLSRGGDRQANSALHLMVIGRLGHHPETQAYAERHQATDRSRRDIIRSLKRYAARQTYRALKTDLLTAAVIPDPAQRVPTAAGGFGTGADQCSPAAGVTAGRRPPAGPRP